MTVKRNKPLINKLLEFNRITVCSFVFVEAKRAVNPKVKLNAALRDFQKYLDWDDDDYTHESLYRKYYYIRPKFYRYGATLFKDANDGVIQQVMTTAFLSELLYFWRAGMHTENMHEDQFINTRFNEFMNITTDRLTKS